MYKPSDFAFDKKAKTVTFVLKDNISPFTYKKLEVKNGKVKFLGKYYDVNKPITIKIDKIEKTYHIVPIIPKFDKDNKQINPLSNKTFESDLNDPKSYLSQYLVKCPEERELFKMKPIEFVPLKFVPKSSHGRLYIAGAIGLTALVVASNVIPGVGEVVDVTVGPEVVALDAGIGATEGAAAITEGVTEATAEVTAETTETVAEEGENVAKNATEESKVLETEEKPKPKTIKEHVSNLYNKAKYHLGLDNNAEAFKNSSKEIVKNPGKTFKTVTATVATTGAAIGAVDAVKKNLTGTDNKITGAGYQINIQFCLLICIIVIILIFVIYIVHKYNNLTSI